MTGLSLVTDNTRPTSGSNAVIGSSAAKEYSIDFRSPAGFSSIDDLVAAFESNPEFKANIAKGRAWVADTFYSQNGQTVRELRLRKGLSQIALGKLMGTSQSHIARIERGGENLVRSTLKSLCAALDVDMNTLDAALTRQDEILRAKFSD